MAGVPQVPDQEPTEGKRGVLQAGIDEDGITRLQGVNVDGGVTLGDQTGDLEVALDTNPGGDGATLRGIYDVLCVLLEEQQKTNMLLSTAFDFGV